MRTGWHTATGFTLVEMIVVMMVAGIIGGVLTPFIVEAVRGYQVVSTRNALVAKGRLALERMAREVRYAVPNSLETVTDGGGRPGIQFVGAGYGTRYVDEVDGFGSAFTDFTHRFESGQSLDNGLYVLGTGLAGGGGRLIIGNTNPAELKAGCGSSCTSVELSGVQATTVADDGTDQGQVLQFTAHSFPHDSPGRHAIISGEVHELGLAGDGTLRWSHVGDFGAYDNDGDWDTGDPVLVGGVESVTFAYQPGTSHTSGVLSIDLQLRDGELGIRLYQEIHVRNTP